MKRDAVPGRNEMKTLTILAVIAFAFASMNTIEARPVDETTETRSTVSSMFRNADSQLATLEAEGF